MTSLETAQRLRDRFGDLLTEPVEFRGEVTLEVKDSGRIADVCEVAKTECGFDFLLDLASVDHYGEDPRWSLVYELYGIGHQCHLRLRTRVAEAISEVPTVSHIWPTANWHEREVFDMMGLRFSGHPELRRILMWDGYPHHPLRKDFPLSGKPTTVPEVAFTQSAPLEGGPFVTLAGGRNAEEREPRVRQPGD